MLISRLRIGVLIVIGLWTLPCLGQDRPESPVSPDAGARPLQAEVTTARNLYSPNRPVWVRMTLRNDSDQPVELPLQSPTGPDSGVSLPLEIVLGTTSEPAIYVTSEGEKPVAIQPPAVTEPASQPTAVLRIAPHGSVGTEVDLLDYYPPLRYQRKYKVEWRPLGGRAGSASVEFQIESRKEATIVTDRGKITFKLMYDEAPQNVAGFLELVRSGFYDGKSIHRIIPGVLIQGGCPKGDGCGVRPDKKMLPAEFNNYPFDIGTVAMARKESDPDSASCQFFITLSRMQNLDHKFTVIGQATDEESLRTLNLMSAEPIDKNGKPRQPLIIRSVNLIDTEAWGTTRLEMKNHRPAPTSSPSPPASDSPAAASPKTEAINR